MSHFLELMAESKIILVLALLVFSNAVTLQFHPIDGAPCTKVSGAPC